MEQLDTLDGTKHINLPLALHQTNPLCYVNSIPRLKGEADNLLSMGYMTLFHSESRLITLFRCWCNCSLWQCSNTIEIQMMVR